MQAIDSVMGYGTIDDPMYGARVLFLDADRSFMVAGVKIYDRILSTRSEEALGQDFQLMDHQARLQLDDSAFPVWNRSGGCAGRPARCRFDGAGNKRLKS